MTAKSILMLALALISTSLFAQAPAAKPAITPSALVLPLPGFPVSVEIIEERTAKFPDGTSKTQVLTSKVYRDSDGRMRTEMDALPAEFPAIVQILDQAAGFMAILVPEEKAAARFLFSPSTQVGIPTFGGALITASGKKVSKTQSLGKQTIEGIEFEGERITTTVEDQPSVIGIRDSWGARELGLIGLEKSSSPDLETTAKIRQMDRHEPDPALFKIPPDYFIRDLKSDDPAQ